MDIDILIPNQGITNGNFHIMSSLNLEAKNKNGSSKFWKIYVGKSPGRDVYNTFTEFWNTTSNGGESKHQFSVPTDAEPKNVGRSNVTTSLAQAISEANSAIKKQMDKGYFLEGTEPPEVEFMLPMLAHKWGEKKHNITFPAYVQPKLDGLRALVDRRCTFWSRLGKSVIPEVTQHIDIKFLKFIEKGIILDGELIMPKPYTFQQTTAHVKKYRPETAHNLHFHVFDFYDKNNPDLTYKERYEILKKELGLLGINTTTSPIRRVATIQVNSEEEVFKCHADFISKGYEGTMIREGKSKYLVNHRSEYLLKYKDFLDAEFKVIGIHDGEGKEKGLAIIECVSDGKTFTVVPIGSESYRRDLFNDRESYVGKMYTVIYQNMTDGGIPRFPKGLRFTD